MSFERKNAPVREMMYSNHGCLATSERTTEKISQFQEGTVAKQPYERRPLFFSLCCGVHVAVKRRNHIDKFVATKKKKERERDV